MVDAINSWIQNGYNYTQGVGLYEKYGASAFFKGLFKKGETPANRKKLNELLIELRDKAPAAPTKTLVQPLSVKPEKPELLEKPVPEKSELSEKPELPALIKVTQQRKQSYLVIQGLHPHLSVLPEGEDLRLVAEQIVRAGKRNAELWERYNYLTENPDAPDLDQILPPPPVMIDYNLVAKREQLRKNLCKAEKRLKLQGDKPKPNTIALIADQKRQMAELDLLIAQVKKGEAK